MVRNTEREKRMYTTETEIRAQFDALRQTYDYVKEKEKEIQNALDETRSLCVIGCGSSYCLAISAAKQFTQLSQIPAYAIAAGDLLVNFEDYVNPVSNSTLLVLSRSGSTSEVLKAVLQCKERFRNKIISICAKTGAPVEEIADMNIPLPWAFDASVCQTRTVTNLFLAGFMLAAIVGGDQAALSAARRICDDQSLFRASIEPTLLKVAKSGWSKAVVLGDSAAEGLAEEGALAFREICRRDANFYHVLDVRHGPVVQIGRDTLVVALVSSGEFGLQADLIADLAKKTPHLLVLSRNARISELGGCVSIPLPDCGADAVSAIYAQYCIQVICLLHAKSIGVNPDAPEGLDPWISLR